MRYLVRYSENLKIALSKEEKEEVKLFFHLLEDVGFEMQNHDHARSLGSKYFFRKNIKMDSKYELSDIRMSEFTKLKTGGKGYIDPIVSYYRGRHFILKHNKSPKILDIQKLINELEELEKTNKDFNIIPQNITDAYLETLERIESSKFDLTYFEIRVQKMDYEGDEVCIAIWFYVSPPQ